MHRRTETRVQVSRVSSAKAHMTLNSWLLGLPLATRLITHYGLLDGAWNYIVQGC